MRYFKFHWRWMPGDDEHGWGDSWWYYEFGAKDSIIRQVMLYDNGFRLRYDMDHLGDEYGELLWDILLSEVDLSQGVEIHQDEFERIWRSSPWTNAGAV